MKISDFIIAMVIIGAIVVSLYAFEIDLTSNPQINIQVNTSYSSTYNKVVELMDEAKEMENNTLDITKETDTSFFTGDWDVFTLGRGLIWGTKTLVKTTTGVLGIFRTMFSDFSKDVGLSGIAYDTIITVMIILFVGAVIFILMKRKW